MNNKFIGKAKRLLAGLVAAATAITMMPQMPTFAATGATTYSYDGYDIEYSVFSEWNNGQTVQIKITNTGDDSIMNWAFKYDAEGEINNLWNATVYDQQGEDYIIKNSGWNYEIAPGQSVNFGYTLINDEFTTPDNFALCSKRVEKTSGYEIDLNIVDQWNSEIKAELAITNTSDQALEAWTLSFDSNFTINNLWDGRILESSDNHYTVASEMWTNPIAPGNSKVIGFIAMIDLEVTPEISNYIFTEVEINGNDENHNINWDDETDTDGDGVPDSIEEYLGSDPNNIDTDGDGLNDYYEVICTYTNPTKADTDDNGVDDGDEDFDGDGLTNLKELKNNTHPYMDDTDSDGLSDSDEVNIYGTNPTIADTDGDGLYDGDEIVLGTNPLVQDTDGDGIIDGKEKFGQTFIHKAKDNDCTVTEVVVDMECTGNINRTTSIKSVMNVDILCTDVVGLVGEPFEIETDSEFDEATLTFKINKDKLGEISFDNLLFLWYNEEDDEFVELETTLDEGNGTVSIVTTHFSKYMVVNKKAWFDAWRNSPDYAHGNDDIPVDTVIAIDASGSMSSSDISNAVTAAKNYIDTMRDGDRVAILTFSYNATVRQSLTSDKKKLYSALNGITASGGTYYNNAISTTLGTFEKSTNNIKVAIFMSDGEPSDSISQSALKQVEDSGVIFHSVCYGTRINALVELSDAGHGEVYYATEVDRLLEIFTEIGIKHIIDGPDSDNDGLSDKLETDGMFCSNGKIYRTDPYNDDTDGDGLKDGIEIQFKQKMVKYGKTIYVFRMKTNPLASDFANTGKSDYDRVMGTNLYGSNQVVKEFNSMNFNPAVGIIAYGYPNRKSGKAYVFERHGLEVHSNDVSALVYANDEYWLRFDSLGNYSVVGYVPCDQIEFDYSEYVGIPSIRYNLDQLNSLLEKYPNNSDRFRVEDNHYYSDGLYSGYQCYGFASMVFHKIWDIPVSACYDVYNYSGDGGHVYGTERLDLTSENLEDFLSKIYPGSLIGTKWYGMHTFMITDIDMTKKEVTVYEANVKSVDIPESGSALNNIIVYHTYTYQEFFNRYKSGNPKPGVITVTAFCNPFQFMSSNGDIVANSNLSLYDF